MKKIGKWILIVTVVWIFINVITGNAKSKPSEGGNTNTSDKATIVPTIKTEPFNIEVTSQIVKKVSGKYRYFFDIRNKDSKSFEGSVKISIYKANTKSALAGDTFSTNKPIEPTLGNSVFTDANTGPVSEMREFGLTDFKYEVVINKQVVKTGEGKITDKFENLN